MKEKLQEEEFENIIATMKKEAEYDSYISNTSVGKLRSLFNKIKQNN
jgi:hypothetical protein